MLRPTAYLTFTLEGTDATTPTASAIKRSYSYIAPTKVVAGSVQKTPDAPQPANSIAMEVKCGQHAYWRSGDKDADEMWGQTVLPWLNRKLRTLFDTVLEYNNETRRSFTGKVSYGSVTVALAPHTIVFDLEPDSNLRDVKAPLEAIRSFLNDLATKDDPLRFVVPSDAERGDGDWFDVVYADGTQQCIPFGQEA